ncbi:hypothetical protein RJ641_005852, partial [Dillenia turbinata]
VSAAMNELRPCAPISLKHLIAQELVKGLKAVSDSVEVAFPHCATCFGCCYPGGAASIMDAKSLFDEIARVLATSSSRELPKPVQKTAAKAVSEDADQQIVENGLTPKISNGEVNGDATEGSDANEKEQTVPLSASEEKPDEVQAP